MSTKLSAWKYRPCIDCGEMIMCPNKSRCVKCRKKYTENYVSIRKICIIKDCDNFAGTARELCNKHYKRWLNNGSPYLTKTMIKYMKHEISI